MSLYDDLGLPPDAALNLAAHERATTLLDEYDWTVDAAPDWENMTWADVAGLRGHGASTAP